MKALIISADDFEDLELLYPYYRLKETGWEVDVAGPEDGSIRGKHGYSVRVDMKFEAANPDAYDLLVVPGGRAPEQVRLNQDALRIVKSFFDADKFVASICHGSQVLISAGVVGGRRATCWKGVKDDLIAAGARYFDTDVVVDGNLISSRQPSDLPAFMAEVSKVMSLLEKESRQAA